ncbi:hypothetical protein NFC81_02595 [Salinispirillum sp. LH 10-3-1]|uniref:Glycosyl hydrolase family 31 C-terminal domain-containing protein n=1 Tax=Salinispirillum sp. LH 10-3-1 TaxID=2952525 RepID=A0AB38YI06_9GAMM
MWRRLLWLACFLLVLFSILLWRATSPTWVELGQIRTNWPLSERWLIDGYDINWDVEERRWRVVYGATVIWETASNKPWLGAALQAAPVTLRNAEQGLTGRQLQVCARQEWDELQQVGNRVEALGTLYCGDQSFPIQFTISVDEQRRLVLNWETSEQVALTYLESPMGAGEQVFGFGIQSITPSLVGRRVLGRDQLFAPIDSEMPVSAGSDRPFSVYSSHNRGWLIGGTGTRLLDLTRPQRWRLENWSAQGEVALAAARSPAFLLPRLFPEQEPQEYPDWFGRNPLLPLGGEVAADFWEPLARHGAPLSLVVADPAALVDEVGVPEVVGALVDLPPALDTLAGWREYGLGSMVSALLSSGLAGDPMSYTIVGGSIEDRGRWRTEPRTQELYLRWLELNTFTPVLSFHDTLLASEHYHLWDEDESGHIHAARLATIHEALWPYRRRLMAAVVDQNMPMVRPMWLEFPDDPETWQLPPNQYMLGPHLLVAPILQSATLERRVYLPEGEWTHLWSGREWFSLGQWIDVVAPMGEPAVFVHDNFPGRAALLNRAHELGVSHLMSY